MLVGIVSCAWLARAPEEVVLEKEAPIEVVEVAKIAEVPPRPPAARWEDEFRLLEKRMIIRNANLSLIVKNAGESLREISSIVKELGGYVVNSNSWYEEGQLRARLTIRVPEEKLDVALEKIKALAVRVETESISGEDVTEEYTDLDSRLRNLEAAEKQLLEIMEEAKRTEDILEVFRELTQIRERIEKIKGRMQYLDRMSAMATLSIELIPHALARPIVVAGWEPRGTLASAIRALIVTLQFFVDAAIWLVFYLVPTLSIIALPFFTLWRIRRRKRK
jgi:hypothetical protein